MDEKDPVYNDDLEVEQDEELEEETDEEQEDSDTESEDETEDEVDWKARAIKAEKLLVKNKQKAKKEKPQVTSNPASLTREEAALIASGMSLEEVDMLGSLAKAQGVTLSEARDSELFVAYQEKKQREAKAAKAKLGASSGSGRHREKSSFATPNLSDEDHKKMWKEAMGQ